MSIRLRLTLLYSVILALTLVVFGTALYIIQTHATYDGIRNNLMRQAAAYANSGGRIPAPRGEPPGDGAPPVGTAPGVSMPSGTLPGRWTQIRSFDGNVTGRTFDLSDTTLPLSSAGLRAVQGGKGWFETAQAQDQLLLVYSLPFLSESSAVEIVQVAFPIGQSEQSLRTLRLILLAGGSVAIAAAFAIGWLLAGMALRPIHRITRTAQAIGAEHNFGRRVEHAGPSDEVGQLAVTFNDMLAELESAYHQLQGTLDSQRRFIADASHELRTPLTTVRGNIELLRRQPPMDAQERAEVMADTRDEVDRLIRLVNQLLDLARADTGQHLRCEPLAIKPLLEDVCRQASLGAAKNRIVCEPSADRQVLGDRDALKQVFVILIDNALVHTPPETHVWITTALEAGCVAVSVRDDGPGIAADTLPHIFERFYRGDVSRSGTGTGLGLSIAKELVEGQCGTIKVESQAGQGSVFTVMLPQASE